jgi:hypothetical protein
MDIEMHRADPVFRRRAPWLFGAVVVLGAIAMWALYAWLDARPHDASAGGDAMVLVATGLVGVLAAVSFGLALALWQEAARIRREDRFPASDMRTLRDVPILHGAAARRYAGWMSAGAAVAAAAGVGILYWGWRLYSLVT